MEEGREGRGQRDDSENIGRKRTQESDRRNARVEEQRPNKNKRGGIADRRRPLPLRVPVDAATSVARLPGVLPRDSAHARRGGGLARDGPGSPGSAEEQRPVTALRCRKGVSRVDSEPEVWLTPPPPPKVAARCRTRAIAPDETASASLLETRTHPSPSGCRALADPPISCQRPAALPPRTTRFIKYGRPGEFPGVPFP
jgi:hypothetical protein